MADRIDLSEYATKYPMPKGARKLMPFQELPFNGDGYAAAEVLRLKEKHGLMNAVETGTCYGSTMLFFVEHFEQADSFEIHEPSLAIAKARVGPSTWIRHSNSVSGINSIQLTTFDEFIFLDAHWGEHCPLLDELDAIAAQGAKPVIMIHDFQVPDHPELGFDRFPKTGNPFCLGAIKDHLDKIYGENGWHHHYNDKAEGAMRGIIYIEPK